MQMQRFKYLPDIFELLWTEVRSNPYNQTVSLLQSKIKNIKIRSCCYLQVKMLTKMCFLNLGFRPQGCNPLVGH